MYTNTHILSINLMYEATKYKNWAPYDLINDLS